MATSVPENAVQVDHKLLENYNDIIIYYHYIIILENSGDVLVYSPFFGKHFTKKPL